MLPDGTNGSSDKNFIIRDFEISHNGTGYDIPELHVTTASIFLSNFNKVMLMPFLGKLTCFYGTTGTFIMPNTAKEIVRCKSSPLTSRESVYSIASSVLLVASIFSFVSANNAQKDL